MDSDGYFLLRHSDLKIKNHTKVRGNKSPYDGDYIYWSQRMGKHPMVRNTVAMLLKFQKGKCFHCSNYFLPGEVLEVHHVDKNHSNNDKTNLRLSHGHCHDNVHKKRGMNDKHQVIEEPCDLKGTRTVLKPSLRGDSQT
jgi:RNA-directed DNA polymerase